MKHSCEYASACRSLQAVNAFLMSLQHWQHCSLFVLKFKALEYGFGKGQSMNMQADTSHNTILVLILIGAHMLWIAKKL